MIADNRAPLSKSPPLYRYILRFCGNALPTPRTNMTPPFSGMKIVLSEMPVPFVFMA
jgi:hypothetical protein